MKMPQVPARGLSKRGKVFVEQCLAYMRAITPRAGTGITIRELDGGTQISLAPLNGGNLNVTLCQNGELRRFVFTGRDLGPVTPAA